MSNYKIETKKLFLNYKHNYKKDPTILPLKRPRHHVLLAWERPIHL